MSQQTRQEAIQVVVRTRPTHTPAKELIARGDGIVAVSLGRHGGIHAAVDNTLAERQFQFDHLLSNSSQEQVYDLAAKDIVETVLQGSNGTIMAYGQTGAGKTYSMVGEKMSYENRGIIPRAIGHIFRAISDRPDLAFRVAVSYLEIYNENVFDLLAARPPPNSRAPSVAHNIDLPIQEDAATGVISVKGLTKKVVTHEQECLDALFQGDNARSIGEHALNEVSTRSHCIYSIHLETRSRVESSERVLVSKLNLIDLAGSERVGNTGSTGVLLKEASYINKSLAFLAQVVVALSNKHRDHVPFRSCRLTQLLKDSLGGNTKTRVICNIHADKANLDETISTLKFGTRMRLVSNRIAVNIALDPLLHVSKLQKEIRELKHELQMHDTLANRLGVSYDAYTPEESSELRKRLEKYVAGGPQAEEVEIVNLRQVREAFRQFKTLVLEAQSRARASSPTGDYRGSPIPSSGDQPDESQMVGDVLEDNGFGLGVVPADRRPASRPDSRDEPLKPKNILRARARAEGKGVGQAVAGEGQPPTTSSGRRAGSAGRRANAGATGNNLPPVRRQSFGQEEKSNYPNGGGRQSKSNAQSSSLSGSNPANESVAFDTFRANSGFDLAQILSAARADATVWTKKLRELSLNVNQAKKRIDGLQEIVAQKKAARAQDPAQSNVDVEILDEEEYSAIQEIQSAKAEYKRLYQERQTVDSSNRAAEAGVNRARLELFDAFSSWYKDTYGFEPSTSDGLISPNQQARLDAQQQEARREARQKLKQHDESLDPEARSFLQATRNSKARPMIDGGRRPFVGAAFK